MRKIILCIILFAVCFTSGARTPELRFDKDGKFNYARAAFAFSTSCWKAAASVTARSASICSIFSLEIISFSLNRAQR